MKITKKYLRRLIKEEVENLPWFDPEEEQAQERVRAAARANTARRAAAEKAKREQIRQQRIARGKPGYPPGEFIGTEYEPDDPDFDPRKRYRNLPRVSRSGKVSRKKIGPIGRAIRIVVGIYRKRREH